MLNDQEFVADGPQLIQMWEELETFSLKAADPEQAKTMEARMELRKKQVEFAYVACRLLFEVCEDVVVSVAYDQPAKHVAYISIEGPRIDSLQNKWLSMAASFADNLEIYPKTNGCVCMNLTFYGL